MRESKYFVRDVDFFKSEVSVLVLTTLHRSSTSYTKVPLVRSSVNLVACDYSIVARSAVCTITPYTLRKFHEECVVELSEVDSVFVEINARIVEVWLFIYSSNSGNAYIFQHLSSNQHVRHDYNMSGYLKVGGLLDFYLACGHLLNRQATKIG